MQHMLLAILLAVGIHGCGEGGSSPAESDVLAGDAAGSGPHGPGSFFTPPDSSGPDPTAVSCNVDADCRAFETRDCFGAVCDDASKTCRSTMLPHGSLCKYGLDCWEPGTCVDGVCLGATVEPKSCGIAECGSDACGNSCGTCKGERYCHDGSCVLPCGDLTLEGCCDTFMGVDHLHYCIDDRVISAGCPEGCGWNPTGGYYECNYAGPDPAGVYPLECPDLDYYSRALEE